MQSHISKPIKLSRNLIAVTLLILVGCGGGSGSGSGGVGVTSTTQMGGARQGVTLNLTGTVSTPVGNPSVPGSQDGTGLVANFNWPSGITTDGTNLYVTDSNNSTIRKIVIASGLVTTLAGKSGFGGESDGTGIHAQFVQPSGITTDGANLYVVDVGGQTIRKIVIASGVVTTLAGQAQTVGSRDGVGSAATFNYPLGITTDGSNLYVADSGNYTIRKINIASGAVSTLVGMVGTSGMLDGTGTTATFNTTAGITTDGTNLYVTDQYNNAIRKVVIASGEVSTLVVHTVVGFAYGFNNPLGITTDGTNLYVADQASNLMRKIIIASGEVSTLAGIPFTAGSADGMGSVATFNVPVGVTTDGNSLYVADSFNNTIRKIQ
jgi:sugar lactone lactonase YvrE